MTWRNWSGGVRANPQSRLSPNDEAGVVDAVQSCLRDGRQLRVVGAGHSFTPVAVSDHTMLSLDHLNGLVSVDLAQKRGEVQAGTRLGMLGDLLHQKGLGQENLGDIDVQSIAGAISTGTHGTGADFQTIAATVEGLRLINGHGEPVDIQRDSPDDLLNAARVSLGLLGIITQVKLRLRPAYKLHYTSQRAHFFETLERLDAYNQDNRNFEFYWFPYSDRVQLKFMNPSEEPARGMGIGKKLNDLVLENGAFWLLSQLCRLIPAMCAPVSKLSAALVSESNRVDWSHRLYATQRLVRFEEMEYSIPRHQMVPVLKEIHRLTAKNRYRVHFPLECRFVKGDDIWLSPAHGRDSAYIAVHMFKGMPFDPYFRDLEDVFKAHEGRPHWGKRHTLTADDLAQRYPRYHHFCRLRRQFDPRDIFLNPHLATLFDV